MKRALGMGGGLLILILIGIVFLRPENGTLPPAQHIGRGTGSEAPAAGLAQVPAVEQGGAVHVSEPVSPTLSPAVRDLVAAPDFPLLDREMHARDAYGFAGPDLQAPPHDNPLADLQSRAPAAAVDGFDTPLLNLAGLDRDSAPPDTTGDVGPNHYLQAVNDTGGSRVAVYNKSGTLLAGFLLEQLSSSAPCNSGYCDPIVLYDELADRWVITEFASSGSYFCIYVSRTPDPTGQWYAYTFDTGYSDVPDYPKYGVWPLEEDGDGQYDEGSYLIGVNAGSGNSRDVFALNREALLAGSAASFQKFSLPELSAFGFQLVLPANHEGSTPPPAGAPAVFMRAVDTEIQNGFTCPGEPCDVMDLWSLTVNWAAPASSTWTHLSPVRIADFDHTLCGTVDWDCMPQPGTSQKLDPIREPLHFPLQYRNFGDYQTLVGCFAEDVDGNDHAAVHWFEIRRTAGGAWTLYQEGVLGGDARHRSVCSAAMDVSGNIAVGYTRTGGTSPYYPSIYYAGRLSTDPLGTMPYYEYRIIDGVSSQAGHERWGDYAGIGVDPVDGCTFWFTSQYMESGNTSDTRIAAFKFDACGVVPDFSLSATPEALDVCAPSSGSFQVSLGQLGGFASPVSLSATGLPAGATASFSPAAVTPPGSSVLTIGNTGAVAAGSYTIDIVGASGGLVHNDSVLLRVVQGAPAAVAALAPANGTTGQAVQPTYTWSAAAAATSYDLQVATDPAFAHLVDSASGLAGTSYVSAVTLGGDTVYYWRVLARNGCGSQLSPTWAFRTAGGQGCTVYSSADVPQDIDDVSWAVSTLNVPASFALTDVDATLGSLSHTWDEDLQIWVRHPDGTDVLLSEFNGGSGNNYVGTIFDDDAATPIIEGVPPFTGRFRPEQALSALNGKNAEGTWSLRVWDDGYLDTGMLEAWSLTLCGTSTSAAADYGDLAASYGIAWHTGSGTQRLGSAWTADTSFAPGQDDDNDDGIAPRATDRWEPGATVALYVDVAGGGYLAGWFDWNDDGDLTDAGEQAIGQAVTHDLNQVLSFTIPTTAGYSQDRAVNARFRLYPAPPAAGRGTETPDGAADGGEVQDGLIVPPDPTGDDLAGFWASPAGAAIEVAWQTANESDTEGFNLYRCPEPAGTYTRLNPALIPAQKQGLPTGWLYLWSDTDVVPGSTYYYKLERLDSTQGSVWYGPESALVPNTSYLYLPLIRR